MMTTSSGCEEEDKDESRAKLGVERTTDKRSVESSHLPFGQVTGGQGELRVYCGVVLWNPVSRKPGIAPCPEL